MIIQEAREWLKARIEELDQTDPKVWRVTLDTWPEFNGTHQVDIGHAVPTPDTFRRRRVVLPVRFWVNEANQASAVTDLYASLSFAPGSLLARLNDLEEVRQVEVNQVGAELFGPTGWLRAETSITVLIDGTTEPEETS